MMPPKKLFKVHDFKSESWGNADLNALAALMRAQGPRRRGRHELMPILDDLPDSLRHEQVARERVIFHELVERFVLPVYRGGGGVFWLCFCDPRWAVKEGELARFEHKRLVRDYQLRLGRFGKHTDYLAIGITDFSLNATSATSQERLWQPHAHIFVAVPRDDAGTREALREAFSCQLDLVVNVQRVRRVDVMPTEEDLIEATYYTSSKLVFECIKKRSKFITKDGKVAVKDFDLSPAAAAEFAAYAAKIPLRNRYILGGIRRDKQTFGRIHRSGPSAWPVGSSLQASWRADPAQLERARLRLTRLVLGRGASKGPSIARSDLAKPNSGPKNTLRFKRAPKPKAGAESRSIEATTRAAFGQGRAKAVQRRRRRPRDECACALRYREARARGE